MLIIIMNIFVGYINPIKPPFLWLVADEALHGQNVLYTIYIYTYLLSTFDSYRYLISYGQPWPLYV